MKQPAGKSSEPSSDPATFTYTCPFLGMANDPTTITLFPSDSNTCFHCKPPAVPNAVHQSRYCLTPNYEACKLKQEFSPDISPGRMPAKYRWQKIPAITRKTLLKAAAGAGIALLLALFFILWLPGIITDLMLAFAPTPASGGTWPTLTPSATKETSPTALPTSTTVVHYTATAAFTFTSIAFPGFVDITVTADGLSCRAGPSEQSDRIAIWELREELTALARDESGAYLFVRKPDSGIEDCWIKNQYVRTAGDITFLPVFTPMPGADNSAISTHTPTFTPTASRDALPTPVPTKKPTKTPTNTFTPTLTATDTPAFTPTEPNTPESTPITETP